MGPTEEGTDSTRAEMADLLEVLVGPNVKENLIVMVDNQSILREISRWVGEGEEHSWFCQQTRTSCG